MNNLQSEVDTKNITSEPSNVTNIENISCPICFTSFGNLALLNTHLDTDHGFSDNVNNTNNKPIKPNEGSSKIRKGKSNTTASPRKDHETPKSKLKTSHWKKYTPGSKCHDCNRILKNQSNIRNCRKCGYLFAKEHCRNVIKLNLNAEYDPENGKWYNCCHDCFSMRPGYNDYGTRINLSEIFSKIRDGRSDDKELRKLQLENRLVSLVDGIIELYLKYHDSILGPMKLDYNISLLEKSTVPWKDDSAISNCNICRSKFTILLRKHHCRLCGSIVCDKVETGCSSELLIRFLQNVTRDLHYKREVPNDPEFDKAIRLCSRCLEMIYIPRIYKQDTQSVPSLMISKYHNLQNLTMVINQVLPRFEDLLSKIEIDKEMNNVPSITDVRELGKQREKLIRSFKTYNILTKQLLAITPGNISEKRIQESIRIVAYGFINEKILPMKNVPSILGNGSSSTETSSNTSLMDEGTPEVKKLSELMSNLTIKEIKQYREELMVFKEQRFMLQSMIDNSKKQRHFDEVQVLNSNMKDITDRIEDIQGKLGDQGFD